MNDRQRKSKKTKRTKKKNCRPANRQFISKLAEDIINMKFRPATSLEQCLRMFYRLMRKHGIKEGTINGTGRSVNNFEWTMAQELFLARIRDYVQMDMLFCSKTPKDLEAY